MIENGKENSTPNIQPNTSNPPRAINPRSLLNPSGSIKKRVYEIWNNENGPWFSTSVLAPDTSTSTMNGFLNNSLGTLAENVYGAVGTQPSSALTITSQSTTSTINNLLGPISRQSTPPSSSDSGNDILHDWAIIHNNYKSNSPPPDPHYCKHFSFDNFCSNCSYNMCNDCIIDHLTSNTTIPHTITNKPRQLLPMLPFGSNGTVTEIPNCRRASPSGAFTLVDTPPPGASDADNDNIDNVCTLHYELMRWVCEICKELICQECTVTSHSEHLYTNIEEYAENPEKVIAALLTKGDSGKKHIKNCIDSIMQCSQQMDRESNEMAQRYRKNALRSNGSNYSKEDSDKIIADAIDRYRSQKSVDYASQMKGLRDFLASIALVTDDLKRLGNALVGLTRIDIARILIESDKLIESYLKKTSRIDIRKANVTEFIQSQQGNSFPPVINTQLGIYHVGTSPQMITIPHPHICRNGNYKAMNLINQNRQGRRPIVRSNRNMQPLMPIGVPNVQGPNINYANQIAQLTTLPPMHGNENMPRNNWQVSEKQNECITVHLNNINDRLDTTFMNALCDDPPAYGRCIFNSDRDITAVQRTRPTVAFCPEGALEGQVSRAWGVCVDRDGNIIVGDRRNNRIQVFYSDGKFKFAFGTKGSGDGQLELPAGVTTDRQNRIIVADKDNHRVQIFTSMGRFLLKFGTYGFGLGQFQYPWDVAVDSNGNIVVTDTRNYRLQMFTSNGHFITKYSFDNCFYQNNPKSRITPRGVCFTPDSNILVTDFENGRIMKLNHNLTSIISIVGGFPPGEVGHFNRPSGICCDDNGHFVVADSKNQRVLVFDFSLELQWWLDCRRPLNTKQERDRPSDVAILPDGRIVVLFETSPDSKDKSRDNECIPEFDKEYNHDGNQFKSYLQIY